MPFRLYVLALGAFALITTELGIVGIIPELRAAFGVSVEAAGWLLSGFALAIALSAPIVTLAFATIDRKLCLCMVLALFVMSNLATAFSPSFGWLLVFRVVPAFLHPLFWSVAMSLAASAVPEEQSSQAVAIVFTGMSAGIVFGVPIGSLAVSLTNWHAAFLLFGLFNLVALIAHLAFLPPLPVTTRMSTLSQMQILKKPALWWNLALQIGLTASAFSVYGFMAEYLGRVSGMNPTSISGMLFLFGGAGVAGTLVVGWMIGHNLSGAVKFFLLAFALVLVLVFVFGANEAVVIGLIPLWGLVHAGAVPLCQAVVLRAAPEAPDFSNSLFNSFGNIGIMSGTMTGSVVIANFGVHALPLAGMSLLAMAAVIFVTERTLYGGSCPEPRNDRTSDRQQRGR